MKRGLIGVFTVLMILLVISIWRFLQPTNSQINGELKSPPIVIHQQQATEKLKQAIRFKTISVDNSNDNSNHIEFERFRAWIKKSFPNISKKLGFNFLQSGGVYIYWPSADKQLKPALYLAHFDVVPVDPVSLDKWTFAPFAATEHEGYIYGRGSLDDKSSVVALLVAVEESLKLGITPTRDTYLAFGHDEEIGGARGAGGIAKVFTEKGLQFEWVLDEGGFLNNGDLVGVEKPLAFIGIAEKGFVNFRLNVSAAGGHSSIPPKHTAFQILSHAVYKATAKPLRARVDGAAEVFLTQMGQLKGGVDQWMLSNLWLFKPLIVWNLKAKPTTNALIRTTLAPTIMSGGVKSNVLPSEVFAIINSRILPGDTIDGVLQRLKDRINDKRVHVSIDKALPASEATKVSLTNTKGFNKISMAIKKINKQTHVLPYLLLAGTDTKHYMHLSDNVYRFSYHLMQKQDLKRLHGVNERILKKDFLQAIQFYADLMTGEVIKN